MAIQGESQNPSLHQALILGILLADHLLLTTYLLYEGTHLPTPCYAKSITSLHYLSQSFLVVWCLINVQDGFWIPRIRWVIIIPLFTWELICYVCWCRIPNDFCQIEEVGLITEKMKSTGDTVIKMRMKRWWELQRHLKIFSLIGKPGTWHPLGGKTFSRLLLLVWNWKKGGKAW